MIPVATEGESSTIVNLKLLSIANSPPAFVNTTLFEVKPSTTKFCTVSWLSPMSMSFATENDVIPVKVPLLIVAFPITAVPIFTVPVPSSCIPLIVKSERPSKSPLLLKITSVVN